MIVIWRVTEHCNLACKFCAYDRELVRSRRDADPAEIRRVASLLGEYAQTTGDTVLLSWLGGEPLLWRPLRDLSRELGRYPGIRLSTTTNGTPLGSPALRAQLLEHYSELTVSVDALGETHDRLRGSPGLFDNVSRNVSLLAKDKQAQGSSLKLRANVVLMRHTLSDFPHLCLEMANWGIEEISFNQLGGQDRPEFYPTNRLQSAQISDFELALPVLRAELDRMGVRLLGSQRYLQRMQASTRSESWAVKDCRPGEVFLFIDELGRVSPCSFTGADYGVGINSLQTVQDLAQLPLVFAARRQHRRSAACADCLSTHVFAKFAL